VNLKEEVATKLIPPASDVPQAKKERQETLMRIAKLVKK